MKSFPQLSDRLPATIEQPSTFVNRISRRQKPPSTILAATSRLPNIQVAPAPSHSQAGEAKRLEKLYNPLAILS